MATYAYDNLGRRTSLTRGNGTVESYSYDAESRLSALANDLASTGYDNTVSFSYSEASEILTRNNSNASYNWTPGLAGDDRLCRQQSQSIHDHRLREPLVRSRQEISLRSSRMSAS